MLTGGYDLVRQAMGAKAAATVWEAEGLARRLGHARVTPLHVASAILSSMSPARGLLLASSAHQLREEDLLPCFDAALSRFPVSCPPPAAATSHSHMVAPRLPPSNALVAALKRAQVLQTGGRRRQLADVKIELEQLVVSILDDPSVYRAMIQAGSGSRVRPNLVVKGTTPEQSNYVVVKGPTICRGGNLDRQLGVNLSCHNSADHTSQGKTREDLAAFFGQSAATPSLPSWLRHHQTAIPTCRSSTLQATCRQQKFAELSATNFKIMCDVLERRVPWHKHIAPGIASTVLWCRSGMMRRARSLTSSTTWLLFQGCDCYGKKEMAHELSNLISGCYNQLSLVDSHERFNTGKRANNRKRSRDGDNTYVTRRLMEVVQENNHGVVFINGINQLDCESGIAIKNLIATGGIMGCNGSDIVNLEGAIVVLSTEETSCSGTMTSRTLLNREIINTQNHKGKCVASRRFRLDLNTCAEDVGEEEKFVGSNVEIMTVVDGVFRFN